MKGKGSLRWRSLPIWAKIMIPLVGIVLLLGIGANLYLDKIISSQLKESVKEKSKGLYQLDYTKVDVNLFSRSLVITNAKLRADSVVYTSMLAKNDPVNFFVEGDFPSVRISGIHWMKFIFSKTLVANRISIPSPNIKLISFKPKAVDSANQESINRNSDSFLKGSLNGIELDAASLENATVEYRYYEEERGEPTLYFLKGLSLQVKNLFRNNKDTAKKFSWEDVDITFSDYESNTADSLYKMKIKGFNYSGKKKAATILQFAFQPRVSEKFFARLPFQKERNDLLFDNVGLTGVNLSNIKDGEILIEKVTLQGGRWGIYLDRTPPLPKARRNVVPSQTLRKISGKVYIAQLLVNNLQLNYREFNTATGETGEIRFADVSGTASNITNIESRINEHPALPIDLTARLMGKGDFKAHFQFMLNDSTGKFSVTASLLNIDATHLNPGFIPLNKVEIKKGTIDELKCMGTGNENIIKGNVSMLYHDLHIAVLEKDKKADTLRRKTFISLVANIFVKNDNPKEGEAIRTANGITLKRDPRKSYFNLLWMALFTGIVKIATGKSSLP